MADHDGLMSHIDLDALPPPVTHSSTSLVRQPTRNDTLISIQSSDPLDEWIPFKAPSDTLEKSLSAQSENPLLQKLKNDYSDFKSEPGLHFFHDVVSVLTFHLPSTRTVCYPQGDITSGKTFSDCLERFALALREGVDTECVRTCVVSMHSEASKLYPFQKMFLTTAKSHRRKQEAPIKAILHLIGQEWNLSSAVMESWVGMDTPAQEFSRIRRPSILEERLTLDSANEISRRLVWFANAPKYRGRLKTYIFRPYTEPPEPFWAEIVIGGADGMSRDVLVVLSFDCGSKDWSADYDNPRLGWHSGTATADITWDILRSIRVLCSYLIEDTEGFAQSMDERLMDAIYEGRRRPSRSRLQYLLFLEDSCRISLLGLQDAAALIEDVSQATDSKFPGMEQDLRDWFENSKDDIRYLQGELNSAHQRILDVRAMIKDQLELGNDRRTNLLTLLAAIYIPFSFISSFFGMNLKDPLWSKKGSPDSVPAVANGSTIANTIANPSNNMSLFNTNETDAIINAIAASGTHLWSFMDYWIITIPVVAATILLPIIVGPVFRFSVKNLLTNTAFIVPILMFFTVVASLATSLKDKFAAYTAVVLFPFGLTAVGLLLYASLTGKDQLLWCGYATTYGTSLWIDTFVRDFRIIDTPRGPWVSGLLPPVYLLITHCGISDWRNIGPRLKAFTWKHVGMDKGIKKGYKRRAIPIILYHIFAIPYWLNVRDRGTLLAIPFAILAANRLLSTTRDSTPKRFFIWLGFLLIWICSVAADKNLAPSRASGFFIAFFPMWALFGYQAYLDHKPRIHSALQTHQRRKEHRGAEQSDLRRSDSLPTAPRRPTFDAPRAPLSAHSRRQTAGVSSVY